MLYFTLFLLELFLLFFLSKKLTNCLAQIIFRVTKNHHAVVRILAIIFLPGTILHELAHLLFAGIMFVPVGEMNVIPEVAEGRVRLGSVQIGKTDPFRRVIIGVAPVLFGLILISSIFLFVKFGATPWWQTALVLYLIFEIGNTMFSSKKDLEGMVGFLVLVLALALIILVPLYFLSPNLLQNVWTYISTLNLEFAVNFFKQASVYLIIPGGLDLLIILLVTPLIRKMT
ncbi:hypothetical protein M1437_01250 [Patescibacteria group bacterium]|nr:hypothetical protein [Patescibacteria group bacterium]